MPKQAGPARWVFAALPIAVFVILVAGGINGSSIGMLYATGGATATAATPPAADPDLLLGKPRAIRTDEWSVATPTAVSQTRQGFPSQPWIGLTRTDPRVFPYSLPVLSPSVVAKPQTWGYLAFGAARGLAWAWWFPFLLSTIALFLLVDLITRRPWLAAAVAILGSFTPFAAWWTSPTPDLVLGFTCLTLFLAVRGLVAASVTSRVAWGVGAGWAASALVLVLYPPWIVSTGLVAAAFLVGLWVDLRPRLIAALQIAVPAVTVLALILVPWLMQVAPAFNAINSTIYPGQRRSVSGDAIWQTLLSAPANLVTSIQGVTPAVLNQSEVASTWLPLAAAILLIPLFLLRGRRLSDGAEQLRIGKGTVAALSAVLLLLLAWVLVPGLPDVIGKVTLLNRVPGGRTPMALGLAVLLLMVALSQLTLEGRSKKAAPVLVALASLAAAIGATAAVHTLYPEMSSVGIAVTAAGSALVACAFGSLAIGVGQRTALPLACAYALVSFAVVNPVYRGLGPLNTDVVSRYAHESSLTAGNPIAVTLGGRDLQALVRGGGLQVLSWTTDYPDQQWWLKALPDQPDVWNNYRNYSWSYDREAEPISATVTAPDAADLRVDLCDPLIRDLGYSQVYSPEPVRAPCLREEAVLDRSDENVYVYSTTE